MMPKKKLSIICFSGEFDKALAVFTLASGAASVNYEVNLFFTFWGFNLIKKNSGRSFLGKGFLSQCFNFLMAGKKNLPLSRFHFGGISRGLLNFLMKKRNVASLDDLIQASIALDVRFFACETSMIIFGLTKEDLISHVEAIVGVTGFLELAKDGEVIFI